MRALLLCSALLALAACHTLAPARRPPPWSERRAALQAIENFQVNGQLAVATPSEGFSANAALAAAGRRERSAAARAARRGRCAPQF